MSTRLLLFAFLALSALALPFTATSCKAPLPTGYFDGSDTAELVEIVCEQHDGYVNGAAHLSNEQRAAQLAESALLLDLFESGELVNDLVFELRATPVFDRHDDYVRIDKTISGHKMMSRLQSTEILRRRFPGTGPPLQR